MIFLSYLIFASFFICQPPSIHPMQKLRMIDKSIEYLEGKSIEQSREKSNEQHISLIGNAFMNEYNQGRKLNAHDGHDSQAKSKGHGHNANEKPVPKSRRDVPESIFDTLTEEDGIVPEKEYDPYGESDKVVEAITFETKEIAETIEFIEYQMEEINSLIKECISSLFLKDPLASVEEVKKTCAGVSFQVLIMSYKEGMRRVKGVLIELIKLKIPAKSPNFTEEITFFLDLIEQLVDSDFKIEETLEIAKKAGRYYVSPRNLDVVIKMAEKEIVAFGDIQDRLKESRNEVQKALEEHLHHEEEIVRKLQGSDIERVQKWYKPDIIRKLEERGDLPQRSFGKKSRPIFTKTERLDKWNRKYPRLAQLIKKNRR